MIFECGMRLPAGRQGLLIEKASESPDKKSMGSISRHRTCIVCFALVWLAIFGYSSYGHTQPSLPSEIYTVTSGGITAHFGGDKPPGGVSLEFGVSGLWFTFEGEDTPHVFKPDGELFFSDWRFDLFSPDGAHVLLLQDHYGPYHIVAMHRLKDYLLGRVKPDHIVTKETKPGDPALVHSKGHWVSEKEIRFSVACCGIREIVTYRLP